MSLKHHTISHLQDHIASKIRQRGFEDETLHERLLLLTEEVGELVKACRHLSGMNVSPHSTRSQPGEEVIDVLNMLFAVAIKLDLDVEQEFLTKESQVDQRKYHRTPKYQ
jgi:NTP pyrophosphatase (non-canonical NTP hydrolase)